MAEDPVLTGLLLDAARSMGATVAPAAPELVDTRFNSEVLSEAVSGRALSRHNDDLPSRVAAARIDDVPILIGELSGAPVKQAIDPQLRRYRNQATIARSWLASEAPNLQLMLIWPVGRHLDSGWRQLAAEIEADDRACRKLVWLFNGEPSEAAATRFLARTFVARPWPDASQQVQLDAVASYELPLAWEEAIDELGHDGDALVERLIALEEQAG